jgi:hypothetical protein
MPLEQLTYVQIAGRLNISPEAARAIVKRNHLPRSHGNDGRTLVEIDLDILQHNPLPSPRGQPVSDVVATLNARIEQIEAELAAEQQRSAGHRADYERERAERADQLVTSQDRIIGELKNLRSLLQLSKQADRPVTARTWRKMSWRDRWRWLRTTGCLAGVGLLLALSTVPAGAQQQQPQRECFTVLAANNTSAVLNIGAILLDRCTVRHGRLAAPTAPATQFDGFPLWLIRPSPLRLNCAGAGCARRGDRHT